MSYNTHIDILCAEKESVSCSFVKIFHIFSSYVVYVCTIYVHMYNVQCTYVYRQACKLRALDAIKKHEHSYMVHTITIGSSTVVKFVSHFTQQQQFLHSF